jgi:glycyl-tRNA synthetase beta chain
MAKKTLAFEIGTEEIPAFDLHAATVKFPDMVREQFGTAIGYDDVQVFSTPRRIIAIVTGVPESTEAYVEEFRGPEARIAFDAEGNPTKAATGFARGKGVDVGSLELRDENGKQYVYAVRSVEARKVIDMLPDMLMKLLTGINKEKGTTIIMVTHNRMLFENYPGRIMVCKDERCYEQTNDEVIELDVVI